MPKGKPFEVGNTMGHGRPRGSHNKSTKFAKLIEDQSESVIWKFQALALQGDRMALKLYMEWLLRHAKPSSTRILMPEVKTAGDLPAAWNCLIKHVSAGRISVDDGRVIAQMLEGWTRSFQAVTNPEQPFDQVATFDYSRLTPEQIVLAEQLRRTATKE
jgi:hypothetical protein